MQAAKLTLDRACAACRKQVDEASVRLQAELRAAVDPATLAQLRTFVDTATAERESLKRSLTAAVKVRCALRSTAAVCALVLHLAQLGHVCNLPGRLDSGSLSQFLNDFVCTAPLL